MALGAKPALNKQSLTELLSPGKNAALSPCPESHADVCPFLLSALFHFILHFYFLSGLYVGGSEHGFKYALEEGWQRES